MKSSEKQGKKKKNLALTRGQLSPVFLWKYCQFTIKLLSQLISELFLLGSIEMEYIFDTQKFGTSKDIGNRHYFGIDGLGINGGNVLLVSFFGPKLGFSLGFHLRLLAGSFWACIAHLAHLPACKLKIEHRWSSPTSMSTRSSNSSLDYHPPPGTNTYGPFQKMTPLCYNVICGHNMGVQACMMMGFHSRLLAGSFWACIEHLAELKIAKMSVFPWFRSG